MRSAVVLATAALMAGCNPVMMGEALVLLQSGQKDTENFSLRNEVDDFYLQADHHDYKAVEQYSWVNRGESAMIEGGAKPSCPNKVNVEMRDAEGTAVFRQTFDAPHCWKDKPEHWPPMESSRGAPGTWTITMTYEITGVKDMWFHIWRVGEPMVYGNVEERVDGHGHDGDHGDRGCQVVRWNAVEVRGRSVSESYVYKNCGPTAAVEMDWAAIDAGQLEISISDDRGMLVYRALLQRGTSGPVIAETAHGHPGQWTVTIATRDFSARGVSIYVEG